MTYESGDKSATDSWGGKGNAVLRAGISVDCDRGGDVRIRGRRCDIRVYREDPVLRISGFVPRQSDHTSWPATHLA